MPDSATPSRNCTFVIHFPTSTASRRSNGSTVYAPPNVSSPVHAEFVRFWSGEHLVQGQHTVEMGGRDPALFFNQLLAEHRDLSDRAAPGQGAEFQKPEEERAERFGRSHRRRAQWE